MKKFLVIQYSGYVFIVSGRDISTALYNAGYQINIKRSIKEVKEIR